jgi:hypothetical protein
MLRRLAPLLVGVESDVFMSRVNDKQYLDHRLATLGKAEAAGEFKPAPLTHDELQRFTTSQASKENLFNKEAGSAPIGVVGEDGKIEGSVHGDPTRFGDWEVNGRCYDF